MKANSFKYLTKQGVKNLWSNRMMTLASVGVLTACLLIVGFAVLMTKNIDRLVEHVESQNEFVAFMYTEEDYIAKQTAEGVEPFVSTADTPEGEAPRWDSFEQEVWAALEAVPNVSSVEFVSKEEALEYVQSTGDPTYQDLFIELQDDNPLPDNFTIRVDDLEKLSETVAAVSQVEGIESVSAANEVAESLTFIRKAVNMVGGAIIVALVIVSLVIITNTIRATIFTRRKELNIMKYVGATNSFIRLPFIVEGICLGLLSAAVAYGIIWGGYSYFVTAFTEGTLPGFISLAFQSIIPFKEVALDLVFFFCGASVAIGVLGSLISIRNHIKV